MNFRQKREKGPKSLKNLKVGVFGTDFKQVPFVFRQTTCLYSESWGPVENLCANSNERIAKKYENLHFWAFWDKMAHFGQFLNKMNKI